MQEKYEKFLQFFSILERDDAGPALNVFDGVSNDEFPILLAVFLDILKPSKRINDLLLNEVCLNWSSFTFAFI